MRTIRLGILVVFSAILASGCSTIRSILLEQEPEAENPPATARKSPSPTPPRTASSDPETGAAKAGGLASPDEPGAPPGPNLAELYAKGAAALKSGLHDDALLYWRLVWEMDPDYGDVRVLLTNEYQVRGLEAYSRRNIEQAIRLWGKALEIDPHDAKTLAYIAHAEAQKSRIQEIPSELRPME